MKFILVFTLDVTDETIRKMAERDGYSDISEFSGEWYHGIERPYLPQFGGEYIIQYPDAFSGTVFFTVDYIYDDIINGVVQIHISFRDTADGFEALIDGLKDSWKRGEKEYGALKKWATS
jgi:hypothetical protein